MHTVSFTLPLINDDLEDTRLSKMVVVVKARELDKLPSDLKMR